MAGKKIPIFDIKLGLQKELDIRDFFDMGEVDVISHNQDTVWLGDIEVGENRPTHDLSVSKKLQVFRLRAFGAMDLIDQQIVGLSIFRNYFGPTIHKKSLSLNPPLKAPYGALDIRTGGTGVIGRKYADLFTRKLPFWLSVEGHYKLYHKTIFTYLARTAYAIGLLFLFALPLLWYIKFSVESSVASLVTLPHLRTNQEIIDTTRSARAGLERAKLLVTPYRILLDNPLISIDEIHVLSNFIDGGTAITRGLHSLATTLDPTFIAPPLVDNDEEASTPLAPVWRGESKDFYLGERFGIDNPTDWLTVNATTLKSMFDELHRVHVSLEQIDFLDNPRLASLEKGGEAFDMMARIGDFYMRHTDGILSLLGDSLPERYIVFNQNQDELRTNGGFPGSVITFTLYKGNILDFRKDDVYYYDWNLFPYKEVPPPGLTLLSNNFGLRDVNYYPIFRETVEKANQFIERSGDSTITTGIAIHQGMIADILREVGPISLTGISIPITGDNFSSLMSTLVEAKHAKLISPKDILFQFVDELAKKIIEEKKFIPVLQVVEKSFQEREILIASRNEKTQAFLESIGFDNPWLADGGNWVYPVYTSLSGNKSDRYMKRTYSGTTRVVSECRVENTVTIRSEHLFGDKERREINSYLDMIGIVDTEDRKKMLFIEGDGPNIHYMRLVIPQGSELISSGSTMDYVPEELYDTVAFMLETPVGGKSEKVIRYRTTPSDCTNDLHWYRQPGIKDLEIIP